MLGGGSNNHNTLPLHRANASVNAHHNSPHSGTSTGSTSNSNVGGYGYSYNDVLQGARKSQGGSGINMPTITSATSSTTSTSKRFGKAMENGLSALGLAKTKGGSGDKETAYVMKQNAVLKLSMCVVLFLLVVGLVLFNTVLELSIARRGLLKSEVKHHKIEHRDNQDLVKANMALQKALETEIHEHKIIEEYRSKFEKLVGDTRLNIQSILKNNNVDENVVNEVTSSVQKLNKGTQELLGKLLHRFVSNADAAKKELHKVSKVIMKGIDRDVKQDTQYKQKVQELGKDPYALDEEAYGGDDGYGDYDKEEKNDDYDEKNARRGERGGVESDKVDSDEEDNYGRGFGADASEKAVEKGLDAFFEKLKKLEMPADVSNEAISRWEEFLGKVDADLEDDNKEVDFDQVVKNFEKMIMKDIPGEAVPAFDPKEHDSVLDYFTTVIEKAKLAKYKQELLDLYDGYKAQKNDKEGRKLTAYTVLSSLERLSDENDLFLILEWLDGVDPDAFTQFDYGEETPQDKDKDKDKDKDSDKEAK